VENSEGASKEIALGKIASASIRRRTTQEEVDPRPPEARRRGQTQISIRHTHNLEGGQYVISKVPAERVHAMIQGR